MANRPFFSLVIPCYNDGRYAPGLYIDRLLSSLTKQHIDKDDLEIIISDDHSPFPYDSTIDKYKEQFNIKRVETDYNFAPGNTRQKGVEAATGQWICFADHDDLFYPDSFSVVKQVIEQTYEDRVVYCDFDKVDENDLTKVVEEFRFKLGNLDTWCHGKFYNKDNFWDPYKLHFVKDLKTHEDIALGNLVTAALTRLGRRPTYIQKSVYMWVDNSDSVSNSMYKPVKIKNLSYSFIETHFDDFITATVDVFLEAFEDRRLTRDDTILLTLAGLLSSYTHVCSFKSQHKKKYLRTSDAYASRSWNKLKESLNINFTAARVILTTQLREKAMIVDEYAERCGQPSVLDWFNLLDNMDCIGVIDQAKAEMVRETNSGSKPSEKPSDTKIQVTNHRPFYSIVIACYNDGRYKENVYLDRLLSSIARQDMDREDLEVILSDDCSPVPYENIIALHENEMMIKCTKTDYNCCPGNTRERGVEHATGQWLCFADHDDIFYDGALRLMHDTIVSKKEEHFAFGDFNGVDPDGQIVHKYECHLNWCHGKFYNKDNFWDKYNIHFIHDLKSHEDIAICTQVGCLLATKIPQYTYLHKPVYAWTDNPQSVSHAKYTVETETGPREFLEVFYEDYIHSTGYIYIDEFKEHLIPINYAVKCVLEIMCYCYFYMQGFQFRRPDDYYKKNIKIAGEFVDICKKTFNMTNDSMYAAIASGDAIMYYQIRQLADPGSGRYIPSITLRDWFDLVSPDDKKKEKK